MFDEVFPILTTPDLARSLAFYRDLLGGHVSYQFPSEGEPVYVGMEIGRSHLGVGKQEQPGSLTNDRITLWVYADDCDRAIARLRDSGVEVLQEPATQPWGERIAIVADPDGNRVIVATRSATS
jgi:lactoylglutathione lyase